MKARNNNAENVNTANDKLVELIVAEVIKSIDLEEVIASVAAGNAAPVKAVREAKPARKPQTREEALTAAYGSKEQRTENVSKMKSCYDQSWSNWVEFRQTLEGLKRSELKAFNQTVSGLARKAGYEGQVLDGSFFQKLVAGVC